MGIVEKNGPCRFVGLLIRSRSGRRWDGGVAPLIGKKPVVILSLVMVSGLTRFRTCNACQHQELGKGKHY
jgi:hypothetical protein